MNQSVAPRMLLLALVSLACSPATGTDFFEHVGLSRNIAGVHDEGESAAAVSLGRELFFDRRLSADGTISCASCHNPENAFSDGKVVAQGLHSRRGTRNTPSLLNVAFNTSLFWDGRRSTLEEQALDPFINSTEHGLASHEQVLEIVRSDTRYVAALKGAYSIDASAIREDHVASALASYQRTLIAGNSPFDRYYVLKEDDAMSAAAKRGLALFTGTAGCRDCHSIGIRVSLLTDNDFHLSASALRRLSTVDLAAAAAKMVNAVHDGSHSSLLSDPELAALGRFNVTLNPADIGKVRTPTLRNVALTAPYMHDGSIPTLEEAVSAELYSRVDGRGLAITLAERTDLVAFLRALTSPPEELNGATRSSGGIVE